MEFYYLGAMFLCGIALCRYGGGTFLFPGGKMLHLENSTNTKMIMKKLLLFLFAGITVTACSKREKYKETINLWLKESLNDYDSYQSISWGNLEEIKELKEIGSYYTNLNDARKAKASADRLFTEAQQEKEIHGKDSEEFRRVWKEYQDQCRAVKQHQDYADSLQRYGETICVGYLIRHKFRAKNKFGGYVINEFQFELNGDMSKVEDVKELE